MTKNEFIAILKYKLSRLPENERAKAAAFYSESIDDRIESGMSEEEAVASLGDIEKIVKDTMMDAPLGALIQQRVKDFYNKSENKTLWIILALAGFPFWFPVLAALVSVILALYISIWAVAFSFLAVEFAFGAAGIFGIIYGIFACFAFTVPSGLAIIATGIILSGIMIATIKPLLWACNQTIKFTITFLKQIKKIFVGGKKEVK